MRLFVLAIGALGLGVAAVMLANACETTRTVAQLLYETEHPDAVKK